MLSPANDRFTLIGLPADKRLARFAHDVRAGLTASPKRLPCCYFYDRLGSRLFEAICELPEYYLTRAEMAILLSGIAVANRARGRPALARPRDLRWLRACGRSSCAPGSETA